MWQKGLLALPMNRADALAGQVRRAKKVSATISSCTRSAAFRPGQQASLSALNGWADDELADLDVPRLVDGEFDAASYGVGVDGDVCHA